VELLRSTGPFYFLAPFPGHVGQVVNLRPIVNRPEAEPGKGTMCARKRVANLPHMLSSVARG
jgi:hypothetical protein